MFHVKHCLSFCFLLLQTLGALLAHVQGKSTSAEETTFNQWKMKISGYMPQPQPPLFRRIILDIILHAFHKFCQEQDHVDQISDLHKVYSLTFAPSPSHSPYPSLLFPKINLLPQILSPQAWSQALGKSN